MFRFMILKTLQPFLTNALVLDGVDSAFKKGDGEEKSVAVQWITTVLSSPKDFL